MNLLYFWVEFYVVPSMAAIFKMAAIFGISILPCICVLFSQLSFWEGLATNNKKIEFILVSNKSDAMHYRNFLILHIVL